MQDIKNRDDIYRLVRTFYGKVQQDELLGPVFNKVIVDWEEHYTRLTDFWQTNLFFEKKYHGDPMQRHIEADQANNDVINEMHFGVWLNLWYQTLDELFEGEVTQIAKNRARNMGTFIHLKLFEARMQRNSKS
ncbi:MAG: group III truncated hemoglobin [Flavobacteriaceae bacterium]|nr:group III truncated hemoglobin [Flavobacteriaceae bacterium]